MKALYIFGIALLVTLVSCHKDKPAQPGPVVTGKLKDMTERHLPPPAYHFEYNDRGDIVKTNIYSGLLMYNVRYDGGKISRMESFGGNQDTLLYDYSYGDLVVIRIKNRDGVVYRRALATYNADHQLIELELQVAEGNVGFYIQRTQQFSYYPDGNLKELTFHSYPVGSQTEARYKDTYSDYDNKTNAGGFALLHPFQLEHLLLLPDFQLQVNNAHHEVRTGDGINWVTDYTYTYDAAGRPLTRTGDVLWTAGPDTGKHFESLETFSWYN